MEAVFSLALMPLSYWLWLGALRIPRVATAYLDRPYTNLIRIGWFSFGVSRWLLNAGFVRVSANREGLELWFVAPLYYRPIFVPWADVWIREIDATLTMQVEIGFLQSPARSYFFRAVLVDRIQSAIRDKMPNECFV